MHKLFISFIFILGQVVHAQADSLNTETINRTNINYKSFATVENKLFAINDSGQVVIWDLNKLDTIHFAHNDKEFRYTAISKDRQNQIYIGTNKGNIYKLDPANLSYSLFFQDKYSVHSICFNSASKMFLVVPYAVYDPASKKHWADFIHPKVGGMIVTRKGKKINKYFNIPQITFIDNQDRIWMTSSFGEFGGSLQLFDSKREKILSSSFENLDMGLLNPKSIFNDEDSNTYITSGVQHFMNWGAIYKIDQNRKITKIYDSQDYRDTTKAKFDDNGIFVGPGTYNSTDHSIYFSSTKGFYKTTVLTTGNLSTPQLLFNPVLTWGREPLAIGVSMAVKQIEFITDNKILFLTSNNGFGIYDGQKLVFIK